MNTPLELETVATGMLIPEGPVALPDGSCVVVEVGSGRITRCRPGAEPQLVAQVEGGPNGAALGPDGALYMCNNGGGFDCRLENGILNAALAPERWVGGSLQRVDLSTGEVRTLCTEVDGAQLQAPNDLVFDSDGGIWFTDHGRTTPEGRTWGSIYYARPNGGAIRCVRAGLLSPNGIALSPDGRWLYWADTMSARVWRAEVTAPGELADTGPVPGEVIASPPGHIMLDSMAVEADGTICVGSIAHGGITVVKTDGTVEHVPLDDFMVTNLSFGGSDMRDVWITAAGTGRLLKGRWPRPGLRPAFCTL